MKSFRELLNEAVEGGEGTTESSSDSILAYRDDNELDLGDLDWVARVVSKHSNTNTITLGEDDIREFYKSRMTPGAEDDDLVTAVQRSIEADIQEIVGMGMPVWILYKGDLSIQAIIELYVEEIRPSCVLHIL